MAFWSSKKRLISYDSSLHGWRDCHSHILFGVDDGVKELSDSLDVLSYFETLGVQEVALTPHINISSNNWELIECNYNKLCAAYSGTIKLSLAAEYLIDSGFIAQLKMGPRAIKGNEVLVESSYLSKSANFEESLYEMMNMGYTPIIAHPERYLFMEFEHYKKLKNCDYLFQLNLLSLAGYYGGSVKQRALKLLNEGMYDMVGSDLHNLANFRDGLEKIKLSKKEYTQIMKINNFNIK